MLRPRLQIIAGSETPEAFQQAIDHFDLVAARLPDLTAEAAWWRGLHYERLGETNLARLHLRKVIDRLSQEW